MVHLHIGIHRTATTFLQDSFFPALEGVNYVTDPVITHAIQDLMESKRDPVELERILQPVNEFAGPLLISSEGYAMNPWTQTYHSSAGQLLKLIPDSEIIIFLRDPVDWVFSLYGLAVQKHKYMTLKEFLGWDGERFIGHEVKHEPSMPLWKSRFNIKRLSFSKVLENWNKGYSPERVHVFFYENFSRQPDKELGRLSGLIGGTIPENFDSRKRKNRSSAAERCDAAAAAYSYISQLDKFTRPWKVSHKIGPGLAYKIARGQIPFPRFLVRSSREKIRAALELEFQEDKEKIAIMYPDCPW